MTPTQRSILRSGVIAGGIAATVASLLAFRLSDWPIYLVFVLLSTALFLPYVEVLRGVPLPIPQMAASIGFLYIGGLPIIALTNVAPFLVRLLRWVLPRVWQDRIPALRPTAVSGRRELFAQRWQEGSGANAGMVTEWATYALGLAVRCGVVSVLVPQGAPTSEPGALAVAELAGYACWEALSVLPLYPDRPLLPRAVEEKERRTALTDIGLVIVLALTPFVFLIAYGFQAHGLPGAAAWSLSALGLHFILRRLNERRLIVEEQNRQLAKLNRELEHRERLSAIGKMSSVVSHQILQQLGVMGLYADLIRNTNEGGDAATQLAQARKNAGAIEEALGDVNRVLTDLLVFSRDLRLNLYDHSLRSIVEECIDSCRAEANQRSVALRVAGLPEISVTVDKLKIKQALVNVLRNAIEASSPGGEVVVRASASDGDAELAVSDRGPGVPSEDTEALFVPFFTTKEHGTGLGLAIARVFTEAHGGRLWAENNGGLPGATFIFRLPLHLKES